MKKSLKWQQFLLLLLMGTSLCALQACSESDGEIELENGNVLVNDHEAVDLGLSVKWATCNLGSDTPEGSGNCYAWGETAVKNNCSWSNYAWGNGGNNKLTKYCVDKSYGTVDNLLTLAAADDVASKAWGKKWRTPTINEIKELVEECSWSYCGNGYEITGPNGNSIFLPYTGYRDGTGLEDRDWGGCYWSSSLNTYNNKEAHIMYFNDNGRKQRESRERYIGCAIRPVTGKAEVFLPELSEIRGVTYFVATSLTLSATIESDGGGEITERGFCYSSKNAMPNVNNDKVVAEGDSYNFSAKLNGLLENTTYYVRAYAVNSQGVAYSDAVEFTTETITLPEVSMAKCLYYKGKLMAWASLEDDGGDTLVSEYGFCYSSTSSEPTINDGKVVATWTDDNYDYNFSATANGFEVGTSYYVRAYAINSKGVSYSYYSSEMKVEMVGGYQAAYLSGAGSWATHNYGASSPEEYGDYRVFPEDVDWVKNSWGEQWRIPVLSSIESLASCDWMEITLNGVVGQLVTGYNGNSIFLPAAGMKSSSGEIIWNAAGKCCYWSQSTYVYKHYSKDGYYLDNSWVKKLSIQYSNTTMLTIRPVVY